MIYVFKFIFPKHQHCSFYEYREILLDQSTRSPVDDRSLPASAVPVANVNRGRRENAAGGKEEKKKERERDERLVRRRFCKGAEHEPRGNWTRQMSHIRAVRLNVASEALATLGP